MKNTQIEWIGNIPDNWDVKPISACFIERNEKVSDYDWEALSVTKQGIVKQLETAAKSDAHDARKKVCKNDFVINSRSDRKQSCGVSPYDGSVSLINIVLENKRLNTKFVNYLLKNYGFAEEFYKYGSGIVADLWSTNYQKMKKIMLPIPPDEEQQKIADFLDKKVLETDNIIEKTIKTIEDYKKYKQAIIKKAVTKGLSKNIEMKDSGVDWIGKMPITWCKIRFKYLHNGLNTGEAIGKEYWSNDEKHIVFYTAGLLPIYTTYQDFPAWKYTNKNDLLLARNGTPYVYYPVVNACYTDHIIRVAMKNGINRKFVKYSLQQSISSVVVNQVSIATWSASLWNKQVIPWPEEAEQQEIVEYLDKKCTEIDELILNKEKIIEELEQYKKSLIYEYVTGKKQVI